MTAKHLIAYASLLIAFAGIVLAIARSRKRGTVRHERINIIRDNPSR